MFECADCFPEFFADKVGRPRVCLDNASPTDLTDVVRSKTRKECHRPVIKDHTLDL